MTDTFKFGGQTWTSNAMLTFGDYGGAGSVGLANIRTVIEEAGDSYARLSYSDIEAVAEYGKTRTKPFYHYARRDLFEAALKLRERPDVIEVIGDYSSRTLYIREGWQWGKETLDALEDYPCIDDEAVSEVEMEWEVEAWKDWLRSDLSSHISDNANGILAGFFDSLADADPDTLGDDFEMYRLAMEAANHYPTPEHNGVHVDVDAVGPELIKLVREAYQDQRRTVIGEALRAYHRGQAAMFEGEHLPDPEGVGKRAAREFAAKFA